MDPKRTTAAEPVNRLAVIGGGIIGLATALKASRARLADEIVLLEKDAAVGGHQSSHNSGVIHSGIYYRPGSQKAETCRAGRRALLELCAAEGIAHEVCGKLIVACDESELPALARIRERGVANGVACEELGPERMREHEPHAAGIRALAVPDAGIVDYPAVCSALARRAKTMGLTVQVITAEQPGHRTMLARDLSAAADTRTLVRLTPLPRTVANVTPITAAGRIHRRVHHASTAA